MRLSVTQIEPPAYLRERLMTAIAAPAPEAQPRRTIPRGWLALAAVIIALILTNVYWLVRVADLSRSRDALAAQLGSEANSAFVLTGTNNLRWVRLPPSNQNADSSAFLMWNAESKIGLMYARGFPELAVGKTYQLWLTRGDVRVSVGTFRVDAEGDGALLFHSAEPIDEYTWARITAEPASGSDQPSGDIVVVGEL
jgi:hypothetical protein